jgi:hypothetical protein
MTHHQIDASRVIILGTFLECINGTIDTASSILVTQFDKLMQITT